MVRDRYRYFGCVRTGQICCGKSCVSCSFARAENWSERESWKEVGGGGRAAVKRNTRQRASAVDIDGRL